MEETGKEEIEKESSTTPNSKENTSKQKKILEIKAKIKQKSETIIQKARANKKKIKRILIVNTIIVSILILIIIYLVISTIIGEEITISNMPAYESFSVNAGEKVNISIISEINNRIDCKAECYYELTRISDMKKLREGNFTLTRTKTLNIKDEQVIEKNGSGQEIYSYTIECKNIQKNTCPSKDNVKRKTTITVNYAPEKNESTEPICCFNRKCEECCDTDRCRQKEEKYPLILLHGHSFNKDFSPEESTEIFNDIEKKFQNEELYFSVGTTSSSNLMKYKYADLGRNPIPIIVKQTYYKESYSNQTNFDTETSKNTNIDSYAVRMKEYIEETKHITGSPKVNVVAHSMGGLVMRRYVQLFGNQSINKLILVGTPNYGIDNTTYALCKILGEENECNDMREGSIFLKKLNSDPNSIPPKTYIIAATGCAMELQTNDKSMTQKKNMAIKKIKEPRPDEFEGGDGIVRLKSALLAGAKETFVIKGTCKTFDQMHNDVFDTEKYPEFYEKIKEILEK